MFLQLVTIIFGGITLFVCLSTSVDLLADEKRKMEEYELLLTHRREKMIDENKIVFFEKHCPKCKHEAVEENEDPCWDCLSNPVNVNGLPIKFEERD